MKNNFLAIAIIAVVLIFVTSVLGFINYKISEDKSINLVANMDWTRFPGAKIEADGIRFSDLGRVIVHQDGSVGQANPPVDLSGQYLAVKGDFKISAVFLAINKAGSLRLYSTLPIIYDQWRYEPASINIRVDQASNLIIAEIWNGSSSNSIDIRTNSVSLTPQTTIFIEHINNQINIFANNKLLGTMPDHDIFSAGKIWFGADGAWTLEELNAQALANGSVEIMPAPLLTVNQTDKKSLKIKFGAAVSLSALLADEKYRNLTLGQFNMLTPENSMKPEFIHPQPSIYSFEEADRLVEIASLNNMTVHGHVLIYDKSTPDWMTNSPKDQRQEIMVSHIKNIEGQFAGKIAEWDVVNEPFSQKNALYKNGGTGLEPNVWYTAMGESYIDLAFKTAHKADPSAKLYLNDFGLEQDGQHWDALLALVEKLKQREVPIDGVGFEAHIYGDGDYINSDQLKKHMEILAKLGLTTRISEIDVTGDDPKEQINQYTTALDICLKESNCTSYTTWGVSDKYGSNTRSDRYPLVYGTSLLWDKDLNPKPAYEALQKIIK